MSFLSLDESLIARTVGTLGRRVEHRFPGSGLAAVVRELDGIARSASRTAASIREPILPLRLAALAVAAAIVGLIATSVSGLRVQVGPVSWSEFAQGVEAVINDVLFLGAAILFLFTIETRVRRRRALAALQELRSVAHVIDMHQLTKDPEWVFARGPERGPETGVLPSQAMSRFELSRYLDYCSEALSLTGKIAAVYVRDTSDSVVLQAVNEIEDLTNGLSRKIWQKLMILYSMTSEPVGVLPLPGPPV